MTSVFHITVHKCASTWFRDFFRDSVVMAALHGPRFHYETDLKKRIYENYCQQTPVTLPANSVVTNIYCDYATFVRTPKPIDFKAFYMYRDPRELIVSSYWSWRVNHPGGHGNRQLLEQMPEEEGMLWAVRELDERLGTFQAMRSWGENADESVRILRFEDFFDPKLYELSVVRLLDHVGAAEIGTAELSDLIERFRFDNLSGGRKPGEEDKKSHYRRGQTGSWRDMPRAVLDDFYARTGDLVELLGYER